MAASAGEFHGKADGGATRSCSGARGEMGKLLRGGVGWCRTAEDPGWLFISAARWLMPIDRGMHAWYVAAS